MVHNHEGRSVSRSYFEEENYKDDEVMKNETKDLTKTFNQENDYNEPQLISELRKDSERNEYIDVGKNSNILR